MKWYEIQGAVSIDPEQQTVDYDNRCLHVDVKDICGSLVEIHDGITVDLVHLTARYYAQLAVMVCRETDNAEFL